MRQYRASIHKILLTLRVCLLEFSSPRNYGVHSRGIHSYMTTVRINQETMSRQRGKERRSTLGRNQPSFPVFCFILVILVCLLTAPWTPALQHKEVIRRKRVWISEEKRQSFNSSEAKRWGQWKSKNTRSKAGEQNLWESIASCPGDLSSTLNLISGISRHPSPCAQSIQNVWAAFCPRTITQSMCYIDCPHTVSLSLSFSVWKAATLFIYWALCRRRQPPSFESPTPNFRRSNGSCSLLSWFSILTSSTLCLHLYCSLHARIFLRHTFLKRNHGFLLSISSEL